ARSGKLAVFAGSFDPPTVFHREAVRALLGSGFDRVVILPTSARPGLGEREHAAPVHRSALADLAFRDLPGVDVDLSDLDEGRFGRPEGVGARHAGAGEVWQVVPEACVAGGRHGRAAVQARWENGQALWARSQFVVLHAPGAPPDPGDLPLNHRLLPVGGTVP